MQEVAYNCLYILYLRFALLLNRCGSSNLSEQKKHLFRIHLGFDKRSSVVVQICPQFCFCGESISKNAFRWSESVYRPEMMREKSSARKCICKILKNFRVEKFSEIFGLRRMWNNSLRELWNIAPSSQCEMKFAHIRASEYFTFAEQIFHSEAISLARRANFTEKSQVVRLGFFLGRGRRT